MAGIGSTYNVGDQAGETGNSLQLVQLGTGQTAVAISAGSPEVTVRSSEADSQII